MFRNWFRSPVRNARLTRGRTSVPKASERRSFRLWLEELEFRLAPTVNISIINHVLTAQCDSGANTVTVDHGYRTVYQGWAVGNNGTIVHTSDGATWSPPTTASTLDLFGVAFPDSQNGWAVGGNGTSGTIIHTTDGGATWALQTPSGITDTLSNVAFTDAQNGWAVGYSDTILHTANGGMNWSRQMSPINAAWLGVVFTDSLHGWVVGADSMNGWILQTSNGGTNWSVKTNITIFGLKSVTFIDSQNGWAAGDIGTIIHTTNGGTWQTQNSGIFNNLTSVVFTGANNGWAVGDNGTILHSDGANWSPQTSGTNDLLNGVAFPDSQNGWAVGDFGMILHYRNGSWSSQTSGTGSELRGTAFVTSTVGVATINGQTFDDSLYNSIQINGGAGGTTSNILGIVKPLIVNNVNGSDPVNIGSGGQLLGIQSVITVHSGTVNLNDQSATAFRGYAIFNNAVSWSGSNSFIAYNGLANLVANGGSGGNVISVLSTATGTTTVVNGGSGNDDIRVGDSNNTLQTSGPLIVNGGQSANNLLTVNDQGSVPGFTWGITATVVNRVSATITYSGIQTLTVNTGSGNNTINVASTAAGATTTVMEGSGSNAVNVQSTSAPLYLDGGSGFQTVTIGSLAPTVGGGTLANINGLVYVYNSSASGRSLLYVDDSGDTAAKNATFYDGQISGLAPAPIHWTANNTSGSGGVKFLKVLGGSAANTFTVTNTSNFSIGTFLATGSGSDTINVQATTGLLEILEDGSGISTVNVGNTSNQLDNIQGGLNVYGSSGNHLNINDQGSTAAYAYGLDYIDLGSVTRAGMAGITYTGQATLVLNGSTGASSYSVYNNNAGTSTTVNAGSGNDTFNISPTAENLAGISGSLTINGGGGTNSLTIDDQNDTTADTYTIAVGSVQRTGSAGVTYIGIQSVTVNGGSGGDTFNINSTTAGTPITINAGAGNDSFNMAPSSQFMDNVQGAISVNGGGGTNSLTIFDQNDPFNGDTYTVTNSTVGRNFSAQITYSSLQSIAINGSSTASITYNVNSTASGTSYTVNAGAGNDTFSIALASEFLDNIQGAVTVNGGGGTNSLTLFDQNDPFNGDTYIVTSTTVQRTAEALITYGGMQSLVINGSSTANITYNINSTAASTPVTILGGAGNDTFNVGNGNLDNLPGAVTVNGGGGTNLVNVNDQSAGFSDTYTITSSTVSRIIFGGLIYSNISGLTLNAETGNNTININSTLSTTPVTINDDAGSDIVNAGSGNLNALAGGVTINGTGGSTVVIVNDQSNASVTTYTVTSSTVSRAGFAGLTYSNIAGLSVNGGSAADTYNIKTTALGTATTVNGGAGNDTFNVGNANALDGVQGALTVNGGSGTNTMTVNDQNTAFAFVDYTLTASTLDRSPLSAVITYLNLKSMVVNGGGGETQFIVQTMPTIAVTLNGNAITNGLIGPNAANTWNIKGTDSGTLNTKVVFNGMQDLTGGNTSDDFKFSGTGNITGNLDGGPGSGTDKLDYSALGATPIAVNLQTQTASLIGGIFSDIHSLVGSSTATTNTLTGGNITNIWSITGLNFGKVNTFSFSNIEKLAGGTGLDTFKFSAAGKVSNITGGGAPAGEGDWLDYSAFDALHPVNVNLALNTATNVSGFIGGIENVIGGAGADILTGDNNGNILIEHGGGGTITGGTGRSLFITGTGAVTVNGGSGGDIFVGGKTSYDTTSTGHLNLMIILAEWRSADPYTTRTDEITDGAIPGHLGIKLAVGSTVTLNPSSTLEHLNGFPSTTDLDWFFASAVSQHSVLETVAGVKELVNNDLN